MSDLFSASSPSELFAQTPAAPLAEALRPHSLDEVIGQRHLLGPGKPFAAGVSVRQAAFDDF